jgi:ribosomal-protein-alanine N-acetyltransferase
MIVHTQRLTLRDFTLDDAPFILALVNEPSYLEFIRDKGVRTVEDARAYIANGPIASYEQHGFGMWAVVQREDDVLIGMCGMKQRQGLDDPDVNCAFLHEYRGHGYAREAMQGVLDHARDTLGLPRVVAVISLLNVQPIRLVNALGFQFVHVTELQPDGARVLLFSKDLAAA